MSACGFQSISTRYLVQMTKFEQVETAKWLLDIQSSENDSVLLKFLNPPDCAFKDPEILELFTSPSNITHERINQIYQKYVASRPAPPPIRVRTPTDLNR